MRRSFLLAAALLAACNPAIYVRDGVTDGDTFYLAPVAWADADPALQSWVTYSLVKSTCQLEIGGDNPARASSYGCELTARQRLLDAWVEKRARAEGASDHYLDTLLGVRDAGFLDEYTAYYFGREHWQVPAEIDHAGFDTWRRSHLRRHHPETRLVGSWAYREQVARAPGAGDF